MTNDKLPKISELRKQFSYCEETGRLSHKAGTRAGLSAGWTDKMGYRRVWVDGEQVRAHRVIFAIHHGFWPIGFIDHVNGVKGDNRIANLRDVSLSENQRNSSMRSDNKSGFVGVSWCKSSGKWRAIISHHGRRISLGRFGCISGASIKRRAAADFLGYHPRHGKKASDNG